MFKVVKEVPTAIPVIALDSVEKEIEKGDKILVCIYENEASLLIRQDTSSLFFYSFNKKFNIHSKSGSISELLSKQDLNECDFYLFDSLKEFFIRAQSQGWNY